MDISNAELNVDFVKLISEVKENGRDVKIYKDQKVIAIITPASGENSTEMSLDSNSEYRTWGETLKGL